jgi:glycosyltransferase involved in cell wall biosynthesis
MTVSGRRPRILLVGPMPPTTGGVTTFMLNLMASPLCEDFAFVPFSTARPPKRNVVDNWGYRAMLRGGLRRVLAGALVTIWHVATFPVAVIAGRIDLVQIQASDYQSFWEAALYAALAGLLRRPVLFRIGGAFDIFHGQASAFEQRMIAAALRLPDLILAQSRFASDYIRRVQPGADIVRLPNWSGAPDHAEATRPPTPRPTCLFIAGQDARRKGVDDVIAAAERLKAQGCAVDFHMVAMPPALMQCIAASPIADSVRMEGPMTHDHVLSLMRHHDIFLLPSHGEGFPNALVEAMAAGMAAVATPVGAVPEMAEGGGVLIVPVGDAAALADAIARLVGSKALRDEMGTTASRTVRARYHAAAVLPSLAGAYRRLLGPGHRRRTWVGVTRT